VRRLANLLPQDTHERSFLARIALVRRQSRRLTGDPATAEDLAQDAYVRFVLSRPDLSRIENLDAYLTAMVRNMHLSRVRRARRRPETSIDPLDYDSLELAAGTIDGRGWLDARRVLREACAYGCIRRNSSKAGSIFLLRFFHQLTTSESARLARVTSRAIDELVRQGRGELKLYLADPSRLRFVQRQAPPADHQAATVPTEIDQTIDALVAELRAEIFAHRHAKCLSPADWGRLYGVDAGPIPTDVLAEIVTCERCLDVALGRSALPMSGATPLDGGGEAPSRGGARPSDPLTRRTLRVKEHRPQAFSVAVNGFIVGREHISGERSELALSVTLNEPLALIEIWSEQEVCLLSLLVEPPPAGDATQRAAVALSDDRSLTVEVSFADNWPEVRVSYADPSMASATARTETSTQSASVTAVVAREPLWQRAWNTVRGLFTGGLHGRPMRVAMLAASLVLIAYFAAYRWHQPVTASELLHRADIGHRAFVSAPGRVFHRVVRLEARSVGESQVRSRQRIETWYDGPGSGLRATRVYDDADRLIAGEWVSAAGQRTVYRAGEQPRPDAAVDGRRPTPDEMWRWDVSPAEFAQLAGADRAITMKRGDGRVAFAVTPAADAIASATLTVTEDGLRPVAQTLVVRVGDGLVEYRFEEVSAQQVPVADVPRERFEPEPSLTAVPIVDAPTVLAKVPAATTPAPVLDVVALDRWELTATWRLHRLSPCLATPGRIERRNDRRLQVHVVAAGESCRSEIATAFGDFEGQPGVALDVQTASIAERSDTTAPQDVTDDDLVRLPAYRPLFDYYARATARASSDATDIDAVVRPPIRQLVIWTRDRSTRMRRRAEALRGLDRRWTMATLTPLDLDARNMWQQLVREQVHGLAEDVRMLRLQLEPALFAGLVADAASNVTLGAIADVGPAIGRLCDLVEQADRQVQAALRVPEPDEPEMRVDGVAIGRVLRAIEQHAAAFDQPWRLE
jgi:RNA polymerase sigma factor (sigma-70 family)